MARRTGRTCLVRMAGVPSQASTAAVATTAAGGPGLVGVCRGGRAVPQPQARMAGAQRRHVPVGEAAAVDHVRAGGDRAIRFGCRAATATRTAGTRPSRAALAVAVCALSSAEHGTILTVPVILVLAAAAVLACVVLAALGRAGEMAAFPSDFAPPRLDELTAADVALLRPPLALWGYNVSATEEALGVIARSVTARDVEIATLRRELDELRTRWEPQQ